MLLNPVIHDMAKRCMQFFAICCSVSIFNPGISFSQGLIEKHPGYILHYGVSESKYIFTYNALIKKGLDEVKVFFQTSELKNFDVYIFENRKSLDSAWQKSWNMPEFKSECWMVASGVANRFDMISPANWKTEACEHDYSNKEKTQKLITHELVHVFHGQHNASPDFSTTEGIDWFVEGLASYASGQCDSARISQIKTGLAENKLPLKLDEFWTGKYKYGLSGSMVLFIDNKYGRTKLLELLPFSKKQEILSALNISEETLIQEWKKFMEQLHP